jgi:NhaP-type Na+/H+ or K+/H+ antiporter
VPLLWLLVAAQAASFAQAIRRFAVTLSGPSNPVDFLFSPEWSPDPGPAAFFLVMFVVGLAGAVAVVTAASPRAEDAALP